jgi:hypothetical protein
MITQNEIPIPPPPFGKMENHEGGQKMPVPLNPERNIGKVSSL